MILLDIGANFGLFSLAALQFGRPDARAIAVDPARMSNHLLRANLSLNTAADRVLTIECAMGSLDGNLAMLTTGPAGDHYYVAADSARADSVRVAQQTIDTLIAKCDTVPTHMKIDVEGMERDVLAGGSAFLNRHHPVVFLELHTAMIRERGNDPVGVLRFLREHDYTHLERDGRMITPEQAIDRPISRLVCLPGSHATWA
jgi:FkbM family methyltransferase